MFKKIEDLMPRRGFFPDYVKYARKLTDAPELYHLGTALAIFSAAVAPCVSLIQPGIAGVDVRMPLHLWVLILGPSGERKTTATQLGIDTLCGGKGLIDGMVPILSVGRSPEATFKLLSDHPECLLYHPESCDLVRMLEGSAWSATSGLLCDMYDGRDDLPYVRTLAGRRTKRDPHPKPLRTVIPSPRVAFLCGNTPTALEATVKTRSGRNMFVGGFLGRMLTLYAERTRYVEALPGPPSPRAESRMWSEFNNWVYSAWKAKTVVFPTMWWNIYRNWSIAFERKIHNLADDKRSMGRRLGIHVLRIASLYRLASPPEVEDEDVLQAATSLVDVALESILELPSVPSRKAGKGKRR